jgi:biopolymer transport protein ExbD
LAIISSQSGTRKLPTSLSEINVTPLVDVMLVLLVIFMVAASVETIRYEEELERNRVERELVPRVPDVKKNVLKDVPIVVPNTNVKQIKEHEQKEPRVVLGHDLVFRLDDTPVVDCMALAPGLKAMPRDGSSDAAAKLFDICAQAAAAKLGPNVRLQDLKRVNFAADRSIPWGWATRFMAIMGTQHGIKQVNIVVMGPAATPK